MQPLQQETEAENQEEDTLRNWDDDEPPKSTQTPPSAGSPGSSRASPSLLNQQELGSNNQEHDVEDQELGFLNGAATEKVSSTDCDAPGGGQEDSKLASKKLGHIEAGPRKAETHRESPQAHTEPPAKDGSPASLDCGSDTTEPSQLHDLSQTNTISPYTSLSHAPKGSGNESGASQEPGNHQTSKDKEALVDQSHVPTTARSPTTPAFSPLSRESSTSSLSSSPSHSADPPDASHSPSPGSAAHSHRQTSKSSAPSIKQRWDLESEPGEHGEASIAHISRQGSEKTYTDSAKRNEKAGSLIESEASSDSDHLRLPPDMSDASKDDASAAHSSRHGEENDSINGSPISSEAESEGGSPPFKSSSYRSTGRYNSHKASPAPRNRPKHQLATPPPSIVRKGRDPGAKDRDVPSPSKGRRSGASKKQPTKDAQRADGRQMVDRHAMGQDRRYTTRAAAAIAAEQSPRPKSNSRKRKPTNHNEGGGQATAGLAKKLRLTESFALQDGSPEAGVGHHQGGTADEEGEADDGEEGQDDADDEDYADDGELAPVGGQDSPKAFKKGGRRADLQEDATQMWDKVRDKDTFEPPPYVRDLLDKRLGAEDVMNDPKPLVAFHKDGVTPKHPGQSIFNLFLYSQNVLHQAKIHHIRVLFAMLSIYDFYIMVVRPEDRTVTGKIPKHLWDKAKAAFLRYCREANPTDLFVLGNVKDFSKGVRRHYRLGEKLDALTASFGNGIILILVKQLTLRL